MEHFILCALAFCVAFLPLYLYLAFTTVKQGRYKIVTKSGTDFYKIIANIDGYQAMYENGRFEPRVLILEEDDSGASQYTPLQTPIERWVEKHFGLYFVGWAPSILHRVYEFEFTYNELEMPTEDEEGNRKELRVHNLKKKINDIFHQPSYGVILEGVEDGTRQELELILQVIVRSIEPQKQFFSFLPSGQWLRNLETMIGEEARWYVSRMVYETMTRQTGSKHADSKGVALSEEEAVDKKKEHLGNTVEKNANTTFTLTEFLKSRYFQERVRYLGVAIVDVILVEVNLGEASQALHDAQTVEQEAKLRAQARIAEAEGEKVYRMKTEVEPEAALKGALGGDNYRDLKRQDWYFTVESSGGGAGTGVNLNTPPLPPKEDEGSRRSKKKGSKKKSGPQKQKGE